MHWTRCEEQSFLDASAASATLRDVKALHRGRSPSLPTFRTLLNTAEKDCPTVAIASPRFVLASTVPVRWSSIAFAVPQRASSSALPSACLLGDVRLDKALGLLCHAFHHRLVRQTNAVVGRPFEVRWTIENRTSLYQNLEVSSACEGDSDPVTNVVWAGPRQRSLRLEPGGAACVAFAVIALTIGRVSVPQTDIRISRSNEFILKQGDAPPFTIFVAPAE